MSIFLGILFLVLLYLGGRFLGKKVGADPRTGKVALALAALSFLFVLAALISPAALAVPARVFVYLLPLSLGFFRGSRERGSLEMKNQGPDAQ